jgi:hypothetical protein
MNRPKKEDYGWREEDLSDDKLFDEKPFGWTLEGGKEAYEDAVVQYNLFLAMREDMFFELDKKTKEKTNNRITAEICAEIAARYTTGLPQCFIVEGEAGELEGEILSRGFLAIPYNKEGEKLYTRKGLRKSNIEVITKQRLALALKVK